METFYGYRRATTFGYLPELSLSTSSVYDMNDLPYISQARSMLLLLCAIMFFTSACVYMPLGNIQADYDGKCFLDTSIQFELDKSSENYSSSRSAERTYKRLRLNPVDTDWGPSFNCNLTTFTPVMVAILSMVIAWSTFTVWPTMMEIGKGGVLMLVYAFFFSVCLGSCITATVVLLNGYNKTCERIKVNKITCKSLNTAVVRLKAEDELTYVGDIHKAMFLAEVASAALIGLSCLQILLAFGTFGIIWFHFHFITLMSDDDYSLESNETGTSGRAKSAVV